MKELSRLALHIVLIVVAAGLAIWKAQPEDPSARKLEPGEFKMWGGAPKDVTKITYAGTRKTVTLEKREDGAGTWYAGEEGEPSAPPPEEPADAGPHNPHKPKPAKADPGKFVSVSVAEKVIEKVAPMIAKRRIGEVGDDKLEDYGLHEPKGTLTIEIGGKTQELVIGGQTPNRGQTYVRWTQDNLVYVIDASIARDLESGKGRLSERQQHSWKMAEAEKTVVTAAKLDGSGEHRYEVIRSGTAGRRFWARADAPDAPDEVIQNWLKKAERLRPLKFVESIPDGAQKIFRVEYSDKKKSLGFLELHTHKPDGEKREWYILTENLRMPATVTASVADGVRDALDSLFGSDAGFGDMHKGEEPPKPERPKRKDPHGHGHGHGDDHGDDEDPKDGDNKDPKGKDDKKDPKGGSPGKAPGKAPEKGAPKAPKGAPKAPKAPKPKAP